MNNKTWPSDLFSQKIQNTHGEWEREELKRDSKSPIVESRKILKASNVFSIPQSSLYEFLCLLWIVTVDFANYG